jgi:hypothetical protein
VNLGREDEQDEIHRRCRLVEHATVVPLDDIRNNVGAPRAVAGLEEDHSSIEEVLKVVDSPDWRLLGREVAYELKFAIGTGECVRKVQE